MQCDESTYVAIEQMQRGAERRVGELSAELNRCGPKGNHSVEHSLTKWEGRAEALSDALVMLRGGE
jgi:hypothetical protein